MKSIVFSESGHAYIESNKLCRGGECAAIILSPEAIVRLEANDMVPKS